MQVRMTRQELKQQAELLTLLEHYENLQKATDYYSNGRIDVSMDGNCGKHTHKWYIYQDSHPTRDLIFELSAIARHHYDAMLKQQIELIKSKLGIELLPNKEPT